MMPKACPAHSGLGKNADNHDYKLNTICEDLIIITHLGQQITYLFPSNNQQKPTEDFTQKVPTGVAILSRKLRTLLSVGRPNNEIQYRMNGVIPRFTVLDILTH
jgi:hypothetical protein